MKTIAIVGAGGFAREVKQLIEDIGGFQCLGFLADTQGKHDSPVLGDFSWIGTNRVDSLAMGVGKPSTRLMLFEKLHTLYPNICWPSLIHPLASIGANCKIGRGAIVCSHCVLSPNADIGDLAVINFACQIGHEASIGAGTVVNPLSAISGGVTIGSRALIGVHSSILQYVTIGDGVTVGAGSAVYANVAENTTVMGVPAQRLPFVKPA